MAIQHYKGKLGEFDYDDNEFAFGTNKYDGEEYLYYKDKHVSDGSKIRIPEGIHSCRHMFEDCHELEVPPVIPEGVKNCSGMFYDCKCLKDAPEIPEGVESCRVMFWRCKSLHTPPEIPKDVVTCDKMFSECANLSKTPVIPEGVKSCVEMFSGCRSLKDAPEIPKGVENCCGMFGGCKSLHIPPEIPSSVEDCTCMFLDCESLERVPIVPITVKKDSGMFEDTSSDIREAGEWNLNHKGLSYYDCLSGKAFASEHCPDMPPLDDDKAALLAQALNKGDSKNSLYSQLVDVILYQRDTSYNELLADYNVVNKYYDRKSKMNRQKACDDILIQQNQNGKQHNGLGD